MPYDLQTPFGTIPGQVTPYEQLQAQTAGRMRSQAMQDDAASAQLHALKAAIGGGGGRPGDEPDFSFATGPKDTGAIDLTRHNTMVDDRQQRTAGMRDMLDLAKPTDYLTATEHGDMARSKYGADMAGLKDDEQIRSLTSPMIQDLIKQMGGQGGSPSAPGASPSAGMNPNLPPSPNVLFGGGSAAAASPSAGGMDLNSKLRTLAALQAMRGGKAGSIPDFAAQDEERAFKKQEHDLTTQTQQAQLAEQLRQIQEANDTRRLGRNPNQRIDDYLAQNPGMSQPLTTGAKTFAEKDTAMFGRDPSPRAQQQLVGERDNLVRSLVDRGYPADQARQQANLMIRRAVEPYANDMNAGQIQKLLQALDDGGAVAMPTPDAAAPRSTVYNPFAGLPAAAGSLAGKMYPRGALGGGL